MSLSPVAPLSGATSAVSRMPALSELFSDTTNRMAVLTKDPNQPLRSGLPLFYEVLRNNSVTPDEVRQMIAAGADQTLVDSFGNTGLLFAALARNEEIFDILMENGGTRHVNLLQKTRKDGRSLLHVAAHNGSIHMAQKLLAAGAFVNAADDLGRTPIYDAVHMRRLPMVKLLLAHGADILVQEEINGKPLIALCHRDDLDDEDKKLAAAIEELLLAYGATKVTPKVPASSEPAP